MKCPKCDGKVHIVDSAHDKETNEVYRQRKCLYCAHTFYTIEKPVKFYDRKFKERWEKYRPKHKKEG